MPRKPREKSSTGIYHVILRGINKQVIFEEDLDYQSFLTILAKQKKISGIEIYGYCLMTNHVHLLIKEGGNGISKPLQQVCTSYAMRFNSKYQRVGHLFQDRFKSKPVNSVNYFFNALAYIHRNPMEISSEKSFVDYLWSSYSEYFVSDIYCNTKFAEEMFSGPSAEFLCFFESKHTDQINDEEDPLLKYQTRLSDDEIKGYIVTQSGLRSTFDLQKSDKSVRNKVIRSCKEKGITLKQLERLTGISIGVLRKI